MSNFGEGVYDPNSSPIRRDPVQWACRSFLNSDHDQGRYGQLLDFLNREKRRGGGGIVMP